MAFLLLSESNKQNYIRTMPQASCILKKTDNKPFKKISLGFSVYEYVGEKSQKQVYQGEKYIKAV